jgi:glucose/arabinose dehydrogenase
MPDTPTSPARPPARGPLARACRAAVLLAGTGVALHRPLRAQAPAPDRHAPGYGPAPVLPPPDTTHRAARWARVVGWPRGVTPTAPPGFAVTLWAAGFFTPRWLHRLPNGDVLVVESGNPGTPRDWQLPKEELAARVQARIRGPSADRITILRDTTGDGEPDVRGIFLRGLNQPFGVTVSGGYLYVANTDALLRFPYTPGQLAVTAPGERVVDLPAGGYNNHWTRNVVAAADGRTLYVTVGSATNVDVEGIDRRDPRRAAILAVDPATRAVRVFASGLRNPNGLAWEPTTGALWTAVNERDGLGDDLVPDYVTRVVDGAFYGWPYAYFGAHEDPRQAGRRPDLVRRSVAPDFATGAHTATMNLLFYEAPHFPARYRNGLFVSQRGSWNRRTFAGFRVGFVPFAGGRPAGPMEDFLTGFVADARHGDDAVHGRPVGLATLPDGSLLVSDDASNVIWRVRRADAAR